MPSAPASPEVQLSLPPPRPRRKTDKPQACRAEATSEGSTRNIEPTPRPDREPGVTRSRPPNLPRKRDARLRPPATLSRCTKHTRHPEGTSPPPTPTPAKDRQTAIPPPRGDLRRKHTKHRANAATRSRTRGHTVPAPQPPRKRDARLRPAAPRRPFPVYQAHPPPRRHKLRSPFDEPDPDAPCSGSLHGRTARHSRRRTHSRSCGFLRT